MAVDWKAQEKRLRPNVTAEGDDFIVSVVEHASIGGDLPSGSVVVNRARFDRLRECVAAWFAWDRLEGDAHPRWVAARDAIQPGDLDPLA